MIMIPDVLYKYMPMKRFQTLASGKLWFSKLKRFNDPFDMDPQLEGDKNNDFFEKVLEETHGQPPNSKCINGVWQSYQPTKEDLLVFGHRCVQEIFDSFKVFACFSEVKDSLLMWAHYAGSHSGVVVGFSAERLQSLSKYGLIKIAYKKRRPILVLKKNTNVSAFKVKGYDWAYEKEWRLQLETADCQQDITGFVVSIPKSAIAEVYVGCRATEDSITKVIEFSKKNSIKASKMVASRVGFKLLELELDVAARTGSSE